MTFIRAAGRVAALCAAPAIFAAAPARADEALLDQTCGERHAAAEGGLTCIAGQRKPPEGWRTDHRAAARDARHGCLG